jgi:hypothetical protein
VCVVNDFILTRSNASDFALHYAVLWRECRDSGALEELNASTQNAFDRIFSAVDAFCEDPSLRDVSDLDQTQLFEEVQTIARLVRLSYSL